MFTDRTDAGEQLAKALARYRSAWPLVLGLPRGGVVVAAAVTRALGGELDVLLVKKLRAPGSPELALGAIGEAGRMFVNPDIFQLTGADDDYLERERQDRLAALTAQQQRYRQVRPPRAPTGRTVILVDDGVATGATMIAAAEATAVANPQRLVVAVPVSSPETLRRLESLEQVDEVICLLAPPGFQGVGQFYLDFTQVSDEEVEAILRAAA